MGVPAASEQLDPLLVDSYLDGLDRRELEEIRQMRTDCQRAEVALSYVRRLIQGRLDIVHTFLEYPGADNTPELGDLVQDLPGILTAGPGRPAGFGHLPMRLAPDTEDEGLTQELTEELDGVLGADEIGRLGELDRASLEAVADRLTAIERRVSGVRRALHERIDALQWEIVERHKSGRATVDGLLS